MHSMIDIRNIEMGEYEEMQTWKEHYRNVM